MRYRLKCPANRYVFKSRLNCLESTAGSLRQSGSEFQTVGPATEKARVPKVPRAHAQLSAWMCLLPGYKVKLLQSMTGKKFGLMRFLTLPVTDHIQTEIWVFLVGSSSH